MWMIFTFSAFTVEIWGKIFRTSEHAYQWRKFPETAPEVAEKILNAGSPNAAKNIAQEHKDKVPASWFSGGRVSAMDEILRAKLAQHPEVREALSETGTRVIIENSPFDRYWGIGPEQDGENMLGKLWMKIREEGKF